MYICSLCNQKTKNNRSLSEHIKKVHNLNILEYLIKYENFEIPKCLCGKNREKNKNSAIYFYVTCGDKKCKNTIRKKIMNKPETRKKLRIGRLNYMKNNPQDTA